MNEIDNRVVQMRFDNNQFEAGVSQTLQSLDRLRDGLNLEGAVRGIDSISDGIGTLNDKFSLVGMIGVQAIQKIASEFVDATEKVLRFASGIDQISAGFNKFEQKTTAVGTLVSQGFALDEVNEQLERLNWFTDETSYNFTDMVTSIGKFTATGKGLTESVDAMEGIALWAALSGQNATKASQAMYQLSQAMGAGVVRKEDYKSIQNLSMDTDEFRQVALDTAVALGTLTKTSDGLYKSLMADTDAFNKSQFAEHLTEDLWFTSDVMMEVFKKYSSATQDIYEYTEKYNVTASQAIEAIGDNVSELGLRALKAGQEARTFSDVLSAVADTVATSWMQSFTYIFGDYDEAVALWTDLVNRIIEVTDTFGSFRNGLLETWKAFGGRDDLITAYTSAFDGLGIVVGQIGETLGNILHPLRDTKDIMEDLFGLSDEGDELIKHIKDLEKTLSDPSVPQALKNDLRLQLNDLYDELYQYDNSSILLKFTKGLRESAEGFKAFFDAGRGSKEITDDINRIRSSMALGLIPKYQGDLAIKELTAELEQAQLAEANSESLQKVFTAIGKSLKFGENTVGGFVSIGLDVLKILSGLSDPIAHLVEALAHLITALMDLESNSETVKSIFDAISLLITSVLTPAVETLGNIIDWLATKIDDFAKEIEEGTSPLAKFVTFFSDFLRNLVEGFRQSSGPLKESLEVFGNWIKMVGKLFGGAGDTVASSIGTVLGKLVSGAAELLSKFFDNAGIVNWETIFKLMTDMSKTAILVNIANGFYEIATSFKALTDLIGALKKGIESITDVIEKLQGVAKSAFGFFQENEDAIDVVLNSPAVGSIVGNLFNLAKALALVAVSLYLIGQIEPDKLVTIFGVLTGAMAELLGVAFALGKILGDETEGEVSFLWGLFKKSNKSISTSQLDKALIKLATALLILAGALWVIGQVDSDKLLGATMAVSALLWELVGVVYALNSLQPKKVKNATKGLVELSVSLLIMAAAVKVLGDMKPEQLIAGVLALGAVLLELGLFVQAVDGAKFNKRTAVSIGILAASMFVMASAISKFGEMDTSTLIQGIIALGAVLLELGIFVNAIDGSRILMASVALVIVAASLEIIADVVQKFGSMKIEAWGKGLLGLFASLVIVCAALDMLAERKDFAAVKMLMVAAALNITAEALRNIADVVTTLGKLNVDELGFGILGLTASLAILGAGLIAFGSNAGKILLGSIALTIASAALMMLSTVFRLFVGLSADQVGTTLLAIGGVLLELFLTLGILGLMGPKALVGAGIILVIGATLAAGVGLFAYAVGGLANTITSFTKSIGDMTAAVNDINNVDADTFVIVMGKLAQGFMSVSGIKSLSNIFAEGSANAMKTMSEGLAIVAPAIKDLQSIDSTKIEAVLKAVGEGFKALADANGAFSVFANVPAKGITAMAEAVRTLTPSIKSLNDAMTPDQLKNVMSGVAEGFKALADANGAFSIFANLPADGIIKMAEAVGILTPSLVTLVDSMDADAVKTMMTSIGEGFKKFGEAIGETPLIGTKSGAEGIGMLVSKISELADGLKKISEVPSETVNSSLDKIGTAFKTFGEAISSSPFFQAKERAEGIGTLVSNVSTFCDSLGEINEVDPETLTSKTDAIAKAFESLGTALWSAPVIGASDAGEGISLITGSITSLVEGIKSFREIETDSTTIDTTLTQISTAFKSFAEAINSTGFWAEGRATGITKLVGSINQLASGIKSITASEIDPEALDSILTSIGNAFKNFGSAITAAGFWAEGRAEGIATVAASTSDLASAIKKLAEIKDMDKAQEALGILAACMTQIGDVLNNTGWFAEGKAEGLSTAASAINDDLVPAINAIKDIEVEGLSEKIEAIKTSFTTLKDTLMSLGSDEEMVSASGEVAGIVESLVNSIINFDPEVLNAFGPSFVTGLTTSLELASEQFNAFGTTVMSKMLQSINLAQSESNKNIVAVGTKLCDDIAHGVDTNQKAVKDSITTLFDAVVQTINGYQSSFYDAGANYMIGMAQGINDNAYLVVDAAEAAAAAAKQAAMDALGEKSPSKVGREIGMNFDYGIRNGIVDYADSVSIASANMATEFSSSIIDPLNTALQSINDGVEIQPTITPVIDLNGAAATASALGSMVNANNVQMTAASMQLNSQITQMDDLVDMTEKILRSIQNGSDLYLDDGVIAGRINRRLGVL